MAGVLYLVGTPIGNLDDFSPRAVETLKKADFIAAEDTRVTIKLLNHFNIKKPMISYFEHNKFRRGQEIVGRIKAGESCALVTDAGMPAISDPGEELVALCAEAGIMITVIPGPCAAVSALALSGLPTGRFAFEGFLDANRKKRRERLAAICKDTRTLIFYEAPHKLKAALSDMLDVLGDRRVALVREMTKIHEEALRTTLSKALFYYSDKDPRGEYVIIVEGCDKEEIETKTGDEIEVSGEELVRIYMGEGMTRPEAVKRAAKEKGISRSELYRKTAGS